MAYKISISNKKGGIGKTTTAVNLADQLMTLGKKVLLVDMDPQRNATTVYGAQSNNAATVYDIFFADFKASQCIQTTSFGDIIPNDATLNNADTMVKIGPTMYKHIKKALAEVEDKYDYIIFDTPPSTGVLLGNALMASDSVIIPVECELFAVQGLKDMYQIINEFAEDNEKLNLLGIVIIKYKPHQNITKGLENEALPQNAEKMGTKIFDTRIRESVKCKEAMLTQTRLSQFAPGCTTEVDYKEFAKEIIKGSE